MRSARHAEFAEARLGGVPQQIELPQSDKVVRDVGRLLFCVVLCLLLCGAGGFLLIAASLSSSPDSDAGERSPTSVVTTLTVAGLVVIAMCAPVIYCFARSRIGLAVTLSVGTIAVVYIALAAIA